jgi:hypothetical protein
VIIPLVLAFTLSTVPVITGQLGFDEVEVSCWYKNLNTTKGIIWEWATLHGWVVLSVVYCIYSIITIINRLYKANKFIQEMNRSLSGVTNNKNSGNNNNNNTRNSFFFNSNNNNINNKSSNHSNHQRYIYKRQLMINRAVKRIVLYPVVPVVTFAFNIISGLLFFSSDNNRFYISMLSNIGLGLQGFLNAIAFSFDPAMKKVWSEIFGIKFEEDNDVKNNVGVREKINYAVISSDSNTIVINDESIINNNIIVSVDQSIDYDNHNVSFSIGSELGNNNNNTSNDDDNNNNNDGDGDNNGNENNNDDVTGSNDYGYDFDDMTISRFSRSSKETTDEKYIITLL